MPSRERVEAFIAHVVSGDHVGAIREFYDEDATMQENRAARRVGREALMRHEAEALSRMASIVSELLEPPLIERERVAIHWRFTITSTEGATAVLDEIAWQLWRGDKIAEEVFFYDPAQLQPIRAPSG